MSYEQLKLENQLCFPVYAASRLIIREYQPHLDKLGITYPQYLVLMVLWENDNLSIKEISQKLILNTNTLTPLLKRMESLDILVRKRDEQDERKVLIKLMVKGKKLKEKASKIPERLASKLNSGKMDLDKLLTLKTSLHKLIDFLLEQERNK